MIVDGLSGSVIVGGFSGSIFVAWHSGSEMVGGLPTVSLVAV